MFVEEMESGEGVVVIPLSCMILAYLGVSIQTQDYLISM